MKIRNFAFFGVMAAIFATANANADTLTTKKVATVGYVNAHSADAVYNSEAAYANGTIGKAIQALDSATGSALDGKADVDLGNIDSDGQAVIDTRAVNKINAAAGTTANTSLSASDGVLTVNVDGATVERNSSGALQVKSGVFDAAGAAATAEQNAKDYADGLSSNYATAAQGTTADNTATLVGTLPSGIQSTTVVGYIDEAVANANTTALGGLDATLVGDANNVIVSVSESDGIVSATTGKVTTARIDDSAVTTAKIADGNVTFGKLATTDVVNSSGEGIAVYADASDSKIPTEKAVAARAEEAEAFATSAVTQGLASLDGQNAISSTGVSAGNAADQTKVGMPVVSVVQSDGNVTSTLGTITNTGVATGANIEYAKMDGEGLAGIDVADNDCTSANPCVLTYIGNNTYKWTNMGVDETPTAAPANNG